MYRYLTVASALTIVILGLLTLTFSTNAKRALYVMQSPSSANVALSSNGAVASASSVHASGKYPIAAVNDGDRKAMNWGSGGGWNDNTHGDYSSDIVQINFPAFNFVSQINVFTLRDNFQDNQTPPTLTETFSTSENTGYGITEFEVQYWNGSMWVTVPNGLVRDNNKVWRQFTFPEVWASGVRVQVHGAARFTTIAINYSRIVEIEAYGRTTGFNLAAAANGAVAGASSQINNAYPVNSVNDGDRTGFNWGRGGFGSGWNDATENEYSIDWLRIDFVGGQERRINEIDVYTLRDGYSIKTDDPTIFETFSTADNTGEGMTDYDIQYLSAGVWLTLPGGKVTNNNKVRRQFRFSPITTNAIRVAVHKGANYTTFGNNWSRLVEIEAWENAAAPNDVVWVEDTLPAGANPTGSFEGWNWTCFDPLPLSGTLAHTSDIVAGVHQHYFSNATQTLTVNAGDILVAHVYLDPANPPTSVMLQWNDGTWEHRAYWGANQFPWGVDETISRKNMGALPPTGQWVRLEVPASLVGLEGRTLNGMAFSLFNGRAVWDHAGKFSGSAPVQPTISISDATVNEGNSGTTPAMFNVTLSSASTQTISVNYATANGTASTSIDYVAASGTVTFAPGQTSRPITIQVVGDTAVESNENFFVNLSGPVNATVADGQGVGTILNDDALPPISDVVWVEDALPAGAVPSGSFEGWNWTSFNPSPLSGTLAHTSDILAGVHQHFFTDATQTLTVNPGDILTAHVYLDPANPPTSVMLQWNDGWWEHRAYWGANQFPWGADDTVSRRNMGALPPTGQWVRLEVPASLVGLEGRTLNGMAFSLVNGRATWDRVGKYAGAAPVQPTISISDVSVNEGNSGTTSAVFTVTLSSASTQTISVNYATANGTACTCKPYSVCNASDYIAPSGTIAFAAGQTSRTISIQVVGDTVVESDEDFFVNLSNPFNATLADSQGLGTILNDDSSPQPIRHFGYIGPNTDSDLSSVFDYTDFTFVDGEYEQSIVSLANRVSKNGMRSLIDLGKVLWCPTSIANDTWHLCGNNGEVANYESRWSDWVKNNGSVLNSCDVIAFSVLTEPVKRTVPKADLEKAIDLVKKTYPKIPTLVTMGLADMKDSAGVNRPNFYVPQNADWIGFAAYYTHPNLDMGIAQAVATLKSKKQSWQRMAYTLDGFYSCKHQQVGPPVDNTGLTLDNMDSIAQEWYTFASGDPEAILIGVFAWYGAPDTGGIGSMSFPQHVRDKHKAIGEAIKAGRVPTYQGAFDSINCDSLAGWAWDASQPDTPISVDIYDGTQKIATVRANQLRQGIGNGQHGFTFSLPASLRNGQTHSITIKYGGLTQQLSNSPRSITCAAPAPVYEGWVDVVDCNSIIGWAVDRNRLNASIAVSLYDGPNFIARVLASDLRSDVGAYLGDNGKHGFAIKTPPCFTGGSPHTLRVKFESSTIELSASARTITCYPYYEIVARHSGKCLDVERESTASGARVIQFGCGGWANQQWQIIPVGDGYFKIVARHSGKVLDVQGGGLDNGTPVWQWDENGTLAQQWQIIDVGGGYVRIMARHSGKALDVAGGSTADGTQIHQWDYVGGLNQQWLFRGVL